MAIQIRKGTNTEWESNNSNIVVGEPAIATDAERFFVGTASGDYAEFANLDIIAPAYDTSTLYVAGDVINRQGKLYSCNTPCSGSFNPSYWDEKSLAEILKDLENEIDYAQYEIGYASGELITIDNGASEIPVKDLTLDIEAVQDLHGYDHPWVGGAGKNKFNYDDVTSLSGLSNNNGVFTNTDTDTRTYFSPAVQLLNGSTIITTAQMSGAIGRNSATFTIADTITTLRIKHNGASRDLRVDYPFTQTGTFTISMTVTANNPSVVGGLSFKDVQIESGSTATSYEPYSNICPISGRDEVNVTRTGKNLLGGDSLKDGVKYSIPSATIDEDAKTITFAANATTTIGVGFTALSKLTFKENTRYTFIMTYNKLNTSVTSNMRIYYTDGTYDAIPSITSGQTKETVVLVSDADKTVYSLVKSNSSNSTVLYYDESGVFEGVLTADDFEPYKGQTYTTDLDGTRYGGTLDVTTGVLTVTHGVVDKNNVTKNFVSVNDNILWVMAWDAKQTVSDTKSAISNVLESVTYNDVFNETKQNGICQNSQGRLYAYIPSVTDESSCNAWLANNADFIAVYELATPQVVQLTPTQARTVLGTNNLWNQMNSNNELAYRISNALN